MNNVPDPRTYVGPHPVSEEVKAAERERQKRCIGELSGLQDICAWCGELTPSSYPVSHDGQTVFTCSENHQHQLEQALR